MLEAKFQEEKLKLQQKHDGTVQKVMYSLSMIVQLLGCNNVSHEVMIYSNYCH